MTSFLLFSISPAIQLLPFVYTDVNKAWEDMKFYWFMQCMEKFGDVRNLPMDELDKLTEKCGLDHGPSGVADNIIMVCVVINVWKPYIEALTMLFLLPNYRRAFFSKVRRMLGMHSEVSTTVAQPVTSHWATKTADARRPSSKF
ncbi:hypothetical protein AAVH_16616 [Aphelenchoides avenae]|nr:hypothetical protein AAVH_27612 [Aphelenchus avenae]KAH7715999.1 hypothetical protein AAVH_16616 [Aphelenchus avenae]